MPIPTVYKYYGINKKDLYTLYGQPPRKEILSIKDKKGPVPCNVSFILRFY